MQKDNISLLLSLNETIATVQSPEELMKPIFEKIYKMYNSPVGGICLFQNDKTNAYIFFSETSPDLLTQRPEVSISKWLGVYKLNELPFGLDLTSDRIISHDTPSILKSLNGKPEYRHIIEKNNVSRLVQVPLRCSGIITGFFLFGVSGENPFEDEEKLEFIMQFANLAGVGIRNFLYFDELHKRELFQSALLRITNSLVAVKDRDSLFYQLAREFYKPEVGEPFCNYAEARLSNFFTGSPLIVRFKLQENFEYIPYGANQDVFSMLESSGITHPGDGIPLVIDNRQLEGLCSRNPRLSLICRNSQVHELRWEQYTTTDGRRIESIMGIIKKKIPPTLELSFTSQLVPQFAVLLKNYAAYEEIDSLKKQLEEEKVSLIDEISHQDSYQDIIGSSTIIQGVLYKVKQVAMLDATVLILGETGTGKEMIARAIHNTSSRKDKVMVKVNCATLPAQLIESELFGHEKGSFTGAMERRIGKFELANGGTIFLDEIGELPLELQAKLLRVLQEKEFERIGGKQTLKADVRVIAATNRNLEEEVNAGRFRADLFYRLNVFPITVPPLRNRKEDLPLFVRHFAEKYARSMGKRVKEISRADFEAFMNYDWPGNIRELEHMIERATIVSTGQTLDFSDVKFVKNNKKEEDFSSFKTLEEMEKEYIISALRATNGKIMGKNSAAELLGLNGKTLGSKMRKLGIKREVIIS
ncbi:MAG: sigma 54-interacting transcriptional regulator [Ignavibacteria bacterium]|nr:sigma 54-interacting transcriptional regulator [Ignavibacteria bacterium]MCU7502938.1 sigma 54-interacting transcriptional regulator [Ignavibacteria bacterium]MCU7515568.1 sigma 54-interacting transcriptional regulator [Ignavibacteria bacterium]